MEFFKEYISMWKRWSDFTGKSTRREYWMVFLINFLIGFVLGLVGLEFVGYIYSLVVFIPAVALIIRRLHDIQKSGWNLLWLLLPIIGWIIIFIFLITPSK